MLIRKFKKIVRENFSFLLEYGFTERQVDYGAIEQNLIFNKNNWSISVCFYKGLSNSYKKCECVDVIIEYSLKDSVTIIPVFGIVEFNKISANLKFCDKLFGQKQISLLNDALTNLDLEKQISVQAEFLKNNMAILK